MEYEDLTEAEKLHFENELLKVKLQVEFNSPVMGSANDLPPEIENAFLNNVYNFEKMYENATEQSLHEYLGEPLYKPYAEVRPEEFDTALTNLLALMADKGIMLHFHDNCYESSVLYKFITEELFPKKDTLPHDSFLKEFKGNWNYIYEEFYPNHAYDLNRDTLKFLGRLLYANEEEITSETIRYSHADKIVLNGKTVNVAEYLEKIISFQNTYPAFCFSELLVEKIYFDVESEKASVYCRINVFQESIDFSVHFSMSYEYWSISELRFELL